MTAGPTSHAVAARAASLLLRYPDDTVLAALPALRAALAELPRRLAAPLSTVADHYAGTPPVDLATSYVETFDFRRRCCLHLTYYTAGDTRLRGEALVRFAAAYRHAGLTVTDGELPDYLPAVLDLAAADDIGWALLADHRVGVDLLARGLADDGSVYAHAVAAVQAMLPAAGARETAAAARLAAAGPPTETVGLEPYQVTGGARWT